MTLSKHICAAIEVPSDDNEWIQIFPAGQVNAIDGRTFILENPEKVIASSLRKTVDLYIDRDHVSDVAPKGTQLIAAGWIKELQARAGAIWARVEWTPPAKAQLANKEYRYISPTFFASTATGKVARILRASLTNDPAFEMKALAATDEQSLLTSTETNMEKLMQDLAALLGLQGDNISADAVLEAVKTLKESVDAVKDTVEAPAEAATPDAIVQAVDAYVEKQTASAKKQTASAQGNPDPSKFVPLAQVADLQKQMASVQNELNQGKANAAVEDAMKAGKVLPSLREWALELASTDMAAFQKYVAATPALLAGSGKGQYTTETASANNGLTDEEVSVAAQLGLPADKMKSAKTA